MRKTIEIHNAVTDPPKKSGVYLAFVGYKDPIGGYWSCLTYGKDVNKWNVSIDRDTGLTISAKSAIGRITHWVDFFDPREEADA